MDPLYAAPLYVRALAQGKPADSLPARNAVTKKGNPGTRLVKRIIVARLRGISGQEPTRFKGDTYNFQLENQPSRFTFRVAADANRKVWWSNTTLAELAELIEYQAVTLAVWNAPGADRWMKQLTVFALPPSQLAAGIQSRLHPILRTCIRAALEQIVGDGASMPMLEGRIRQALGVADLQNWEVPGGEEERVRDRIAEGHPGSGHPGSTPYIVHSDLA